MKRIITIIAIIICGFANAQTGYLVQPAKWKFIKPQWLDSGMWIKNIPKYGGQNRVLVYDSTTNRVGYKYINNGSSYTAGRGLTLNSNVFRLDTTQGYTWTNQKTIFNATPISTPNYGVINFGNGGFSGGANHFTGNASGTGLAMNLASGYAGDLMNLQVGGSSRFKVDNSGTGIFAYALNVAWPGVYTTNIRSSSNSETHIGLESATLLTFNVASALGSFSWKNGGVEWANMSSSKFKIPELLQFGGTTSSFPALKRNATGLDVRLADDSGYSNITAKNGKLSGVLFTQTATATVANTTTETTVTSTGSGSLTLPANFFEVGKSIVIHAEGFHSAVANPNITVKIKIGGTTYLTTGTVVSGNSTNAYCEIKGTITCRTTGASGTVQAQGFFVETGGGDNHFGMPNTTTQTIDTTVTQTVDVTVQWGTASSSNTISITNLIIEAKN